MSRDICICLDFLSDDHKARIRSAAEAAGFTPYFFTRAQFDEAAECLQHCEILFACDEELLRTAPASLQWYQCAYAGVDPYCREPGLFANPDCLLTNSNCYGVTISEHVLMTVLMLLRRMPYYQSNMGQQLWPSSVGEIRSIQDGSFTLLGTGNIGSNIARRLKALGAAQVIGVNRSGRTQPDFDRVYPISALDDLLPRTECLIMAIPSTPETARILSRERIEALPKGACIVNVGRGTAIDQEALADALNSGHLSGAALDVMVPEPLPPQHPLWTAKNLILTPHIAGDTSLPYTRDRITALFCANLAHYAAGEPLQGLVDRRQGY